MRRGITLSSRLSAALSGVEGASLADIGCDHGKLCVQALLSGAVSTAYAVDISAPSLAKAERLAADYGVSVVPLLSDGLCDVPSTVENVVVAGMGGYEIAGILSRAPFLPARLSLIPHRNADVLRKVLFLTGYHVVADHMVEDGGLYYPHIIAQRTPQAQRVDSWETQIDTLPYLPLWHMGIWDLYGEDHPSYPGSHALFCAYCQERTAYLAHIIALGNRTPAILDEHRTLSSIIKEK